MADVSFIPDGVGGLAGWVIAVVTTTVAFLFKMLDKSRTEQINDLIKRCDASDQKHQECQRDRFELAKQIGTIRHEMAEVRSKIDGQN